MPLNNNHSGIYLNSGTVAGCVASENGGKGIVTLGACRCPWQCGFQ